MSDEKVKITPDVAKYTDARSASGAKTKHTNDVVANALEGATIEEVKEIAAKMGVENVNNYDHLNAGQVRMNLGNRIRGAINKIEKEKEGSGVAKFEKASVIIRKAVAKRQADAEKAAKAKPAPKGRKSKAA